MSESLDPRLNDVAAALSALAPRPAALDRDRLLFRAGRASAPRPWFWRLSAAASTIAAVVLAAILLVRPAPTPIERVVYVQVTPAPIPAPPMEVAVTPPAPLESEPQEPAYSWPSTPYTRLEDRLLRWGLDGLGEPSPAPAAPPETLKSLLQSL
ncbi:MAG TPA: hypothetical protein DDY78_15000 [Planctomycetales bacterium]|jgi:hypothetical protein|nr:hypothetical protein [Planctomycetales bacterium]